MISGPGGRAVLLIDAKYKPSSTLPERDEANQVVTYATRYGCQKAMLVFPDREPAVAYVREIGKVGNVAVFVGNVSLGAAELDVEVAGFAAAAASFECAFRPYVRSDVN